MTAFSPNPPVAEVTTLLRELNHRIDNQFASAINLISTEAVRAESEEAKVALSNTVELLQAYEEVHRALLMPQCGILVDALKYLRKLSGALRSALLGRLHIQLVLNGVPLALQSERCWQLGLIVHELVTNASKHACFDGRPGEIKIKLARADWLLNCVVSDNGSVPSRANLGQGQGLRIIGELARRLGGRIEHGIGADFRSVVLSFRLTERERSANRAIDVRAARAPLRLKSMAAGGQADGRRKPLDQDGRRAGAAASAQPNNVTAASGRNSTPLCCADVLGELLSPSHRMDVS